MNKKTIRNSTAEFLIYQAKNGEVKLDVRLEDETIWLTQTQMSELFGKAVSTINEHIKNIYAEGELVKEGSLRKFGNSEFSTKPTNLDLCSIFRDFIFCLTKKIKSPSSKTRGVCRHHLKLGGCVAII